MTAVRVIVVAGRRCARVEVYFSLSIYIYRERGVYSRLEVRGLEICRVIWGWAELDGNWMWSRIGCGLTLSYAIGYITQYYDGMNRLGL